MPITLTILLVALGAFQQKPAEPSEPKRGDKVVVRGCISGGTIESAETEVYESTGKYRGFVTYRLTGDKKVLKQLKQEHEGHIDVITGVLKTNLPPQNAPHGKRIGNTRVVVGIGQVPRNDPHAPPYLPALEVGELEHTEVTCRK
jgi:hypothetical protein